jgi:hypothetical protein
MAYPNEECTCDDRKEITDEEFEEIRSLINEECWMWRT